MIFRSRPVFVLALLVSLLPFGPLFAQEGREVNFRVVCYKHIDGVLSAYVSSGKSGGSLEVPLLSGNFTETIKANFSSGNAVLFLPDPEVPSGRRVVASGKLASGKQQLFILLPDSTKAMPYRILAMNDDEKAFPMGAVRILNLSPGPVRFNLAGATLKPILPGKVVVYPPVKAVDEWGMYQVRIEYGTPDNKWIPVATPSWKGTPLKRDLVITSLEAKTKQPSISYYKDIPPWRKAVLVPPTE